MGITAAEAAEILGTSRGAVYKAIHQGKLPKAPKFANAALDRDDVEQLSLVRLKRGTPHPYWATTTEAAEILGVTPRRVTQLVRKGFVPAVEHDGRWYYRRPQLEVVANARAARAWADAREGSPGVHGVLVKRAEADGSATGDPVNNLGDLDSRTKSAGGHLLVG